MSGGVAGGKAGAKTKKKKPRIVGKRKTKAVVALEQRVEELEEELARAQEETAEAADRAIRTLAEFDNYRRRNERERGEAAQRAISDILLELLEVADNFDRALEHAGEDVPEAFLEGMRLTQRGLHGLLDRRGVSRIEAVGAEFDPERHEALASQPDPEAEPNTVLQEIQAGYLLGERVLRPAKVVVSRGE